MAPDIGTAQDWVILLALLFPVPFFIPVLTSAVTAWVLRLGPVALVWGVLFGIATVPLSLVFLRFSVVTFHFPSGWYGWKEVELAHSVLAADAAFGVGHAHNASPFPKRRPAPRL